MKKLIFLILLLISLSTAQLSTRFMVFGDTHIGSPVSDFKKTIFYELVCAAINEKVDFVFLAGDLVIRNFGVAEKDSAFRDWYFVMDTLGQHNIQFYAARGNNDFDKSAWDSLFYGEYSFPPNGPENEKNITYTINYNNILFIVLDQFTQSLRINQEWLDEILTANTKKHIFAAGHEPAFKLYNSTNLGVHPAARDSMWESLLSAGVKIFFCGHDHFYDHTIIDDRNENPDDDMHQMIVGTGNYFFSDSDYDGDNGRWTPTRIFHEQNNGYVLVEVSANSVQTTWKHRVEPGIYEVGGDSFNYTITSIEKKIKNQPAYSLLQNYPNPFNPVTNFEFRTSSFEFVSLKVYNILGREMVTLVNKKLPAGNHTAQWNASGFASGVYLYMLKAGNNYKQTRKLVLLK